MNAALLGELRRLRVDEWGESCLHPRGVVSLWGAKVAQRLQSKVYTVRDMRPCSRTATGPQEMSLGVCVRIYFQTVYCGNIISNDGELIR